ncbi:hypothetical protein NBRC116594_35720 [Shimia sp. NS0008-38b]|uniref:hypothetical protein n=1 Tax=Shimia sp. NS0008-38b TaxID=3127653 RepID=UPI00310A06B1
MTEKQSQLVRVLAFSKRVSFVAATVCAVALLLSVPTSAQEGANLDDIQRQRSDSADAENGTNPTKLTTQMGLQYSYNKINPSLNNGLLEFFYQHPIGDGSKALKVTVPFADNPNLRQNLNLFEENAVGDVSLTFLNVFHLTPKAGAAYTAELFLNTASNGAGYGQMALETSLFYAMFLDNGAIFAPAWVQTFGLEGGNSAGKKLNTTTLDFYYVPKLPNRKLFMTFDPAIVHDWESSDTFGSLQVTLGMLTGKLFGGDSQVFIKPGVGIGKDAPFDWSFEVGFKVLNF